MCVFNVSKRRRSWILGQVVSLWAEVLCNHTHTNTLRTAARSAGRGCRGGGTCPLTSTHTHTTFLSLCLLSPTPCQALTAWQIREEGTADCSPLLLQIRQWGPQVIAPSDTAGPVPPYQEVSSLLSPQTPRHIGQYYRSVISPVT